jgi:multiple sugar transport system ATP-binding protein
MTQVTVSGLTKVFDDGGEDIVAVDDVSFEVADGEFVVLVGPSGCGKTTTLRMVGGLETPTDGTLEFDGTVVNDVKARNRDVAMVFQDFALYPHMNVARNLGFGLRRENNDYSEEEIEKRVNDVAEILEIEELLSKSPGELSGGQKQRVALGRAIVREPRLFLFDEPLANLDANLRKTMRTEIDALQSQMGITSLYVTHNQEEAMTMADRIAILDDGQLQQIGTPEEVFNSPANTFVAEFIGSPNINLSTGELERSSDTVTVTTSSFEVDIPTDAVPSDMANQSVTLGVRPQDLRPVADPSESDMVLTGSVSLIEPLGTEAIVRLDTPEGDVTALISGYESLDREQELSLTVDPEKLYLFDTEDQLIKPRNYEYRQDDEIPARSISPTELNNDIVGEQFHPTRIREVDEPALELRHAAFDPCLDGRGTLLGCSENEVVIGILAGDVRLISVLLLELDGSHQIEQTLPFLLVPGADDVPVPRVFDLVGVASHRLAMVLDDTDLVFEGVEVAIEHVGVPYVREFRNELERDLFASTANQNWRVGVLDRTGLAVRVVGLVVVALETGTVACSVVGPHLFHESDCLVESHQPLEAIAVLPAVSVVLGFVPAGAQSEFETAARNDVKRGSHLRDECGVAVVVTEDQ